jgi:hypothetical protein
MTIYLHRKWNTAKEWIKTHPFDYKRNIKNNKDKIYDKIIKLA